MPLPTLNPRNASLAAQPPHPLGGLGNPPLGLHWMAQATGIAPAHLADPRRTHRFLLMLAARLGLTAMGAPVVHALPGGTIAGVLVLSQSHASVHADPAGGVLFADVFSCAHFAPADAGAVLAACWPGASICDSTIKRGHSA